MKRAIALFALIGAVHMSAEAASQLHLTSSVFTQGQAIPTEFTCEGKNISPPLKWTGIPSRAKSLVLIVDDPDAPDPNAPRMTWVHWVVYNIPAHSKEFAQDVKSFPKGTLMGINSWNKPSYGGPCPPIGRHRYFFKLYALSKDLPDLHNPSKQQLEKAMGSFVVGQTYLIGTYEKQHK